MVWLYSLLAIAGYFALVILIGRAWTSSMARKRHNRVAALASLFDLGTAKVDGSNEFRGYFYLPSISGLFHGRPARFAIVPGDIIRVSVAGRFVLPFQVRAKKFSNLGIIRGVPPVFLIGFVLLIWPLRMLLGRATFLTFAAGPIVVVLALITVWKYRPKIGDVEFAKETRAKASFPGSESLVFSTDFPAEFHAMIARADVQEIVARLIKKRGVDHLRTIPIPFKFKPFDSKAEANFFYRRRLLDPAYVRDLVTDLLTLCERIESPGPTNELAEVATAQPV